MCRSLFILNWIIVVVAAAVTLYLILSPRMARSESWKATVTPLASIMGSGFLVSAPLLAGAVGNLAVLCMAGLLLLAYGVGGAIRFNICHFEPIEDQRGSAQGIAFLSRVVLIGAYFISISYYLQLLAAFLLQSLGVADQTLAPWMSSVTLVLICGLGAWRGLAQLESVEKYAVSLNLGMIVALLLALAVYNVQLWLGGEWQLPDISSSIDFTDLRVLLGLLIVVQGFETSRYLGSEHPAALRIATMRNAQLISTAIYLPFLALATVLFHPGMNADVTEIIEMVRPVAMVLPILLVVTALGSQFSAAVADVEGASGLIEDISRHRVPLRMAYLAIMVVTVLLTWETDVNEIIAYASRAFALFYMLQCMVALMVSRQSSDTANNRGQQLLFAVLTIICALVFLLGLPAES